MVFQIKFHQKDKELPVLPEDVEAASRASPV
jgi:hypothetical protein